MFCIDCDLELYEAQYGLTCLNGFCPQFEVVIKVNKKEINMVAEEFLNIVFASEITVELMLKNLESRNLATQKLINKRVREDRPYLIEDWENIQRDHGYEIL